MGAPPAGLRAHRLVQGARDTKGGRQKKTATVALARKLLVALWKHINAGVIIEGAVSRASLASNPGVLAICQGRSNLVGPR